MAPISMLDEASTLNEISRNIPIINVSLEDQQVYNQSTTFEVEGKFLNTLVSILIDSGASLSYIAPKIVEKWKLVKEKQKNAWMVHLARGVKWKVT